MSDMIERQTLSGRVVEQLRADIITRVFPVGSHITVKSIAERYNTSPLPVREAFSVLSGEKLITLAPYKGATVCPIDRQFFINIYRILNALELMMIDTTMENWSEPLDRELTQINEEIHGLQTMSLIWERYQDLNESFHGKLEQFSTNEQALELMAQYRRIIRLITWEYAAVLSSVDRLNKSYEEHRAILDAYRSHDLDACTKAYRVHAENSRESAVEKIFGKE